MQEEVSSKTIAFCVRTGKMTASVLLKVLRSYLNSQKQKTMVKKQAAKNARAEKKVTGKVTVKELARQNAGMTNIEITNKNIRSFERYARKYGINYALKKDKTKDPPVYLVFFKGRDQDAITAAFREFTNAQIKRANHVGIRKKLALHRAAVKQQKQTKVKHKKQVQTR